MPVAASTYANTLPAIIATIMYGMRRQDACVAASATTSVTPPVAVIQGSKLAASRKNACSVSKKLAPAGTGTPKKFRSCAAMISRPAPAVNADDHRVRDEVDERAQARDAHRELEQAHQQRERQHELDVRRRCRGAASGAIVANTTSDIALVGPRDLVPRRAPERRDDRRHHRAVEAVLRRQAGERRVGDACGSTTSAPTRPA